MNCPFCGAKMQLGTGSLQDTHVCKNHVSKENKK
jgi:hypothetical protein